MNELLWAWNLGGGKQLEVVLGDLTEERVEAIVNAANEHLAHGGGVAGAIRRKGGPLIQQESDAWVREHGPVVTGTAAITGAGALPARYVIHAVGPVWGSGDEEAKLAGAVRSALALAEQYGLESLALPGISSGIFGGPKAICARVIVEAGLAHLREQPEGRVRLLRFCNIDRATAEAFVAAARQLRERDQAAGGSM